MRLVIPLPSFFLRLTQSLPRNLPLPKTWTSGGIANHLFICWQQCENHNAVQLQLGLYYNCYYHHHLRQVHACTWSITFLFYSTHTFHRTDDDRFFPVHFTIILSSTRNCAALICTRAQEQFAFHCPLILLLVLLFTAWSNVNSRA